MGFDEFHAYRGVGAIDRSVNVFVVMEVISSRSTFSLVIVVISSGMPDPIMRFEASSGRQVG